MALSVTITIPGNPPVTLSEDDAVDVGSYIDSAIDAAGPPVVDPTDEPVTLDWLSAEVALKAHVETQWAATPYADVPLVWENSLDDPADTMVAVAIEGIYAEKTLYGSRGKRNSIEAGIVFFHAFVPIGTGKSGCVAMVETMTSLLELRTVAPGVNMDGGNPPSPVEFRMSDRGVPTQQPNGNYYRCSGSVPFIVISVR